MRLEGKVAIVTGADTGIGKGISTCLAREGAAVTIGYLGEREPADDLVGKIEAAGGKALAVALDVTQADQIDHCIEQTVSTFGKLDIFVNNAGMETKKPFLDVPYDLYSKTIAVNLTGPWMCAQKAAHRW